MAKGTCKSVRIVIYAGPKIRGHLEKMKRGELHGNSLSAVARTLLCEAIRVEIRLSKARVRK